MSDRRPADIPDWPQFSGWPDFPHWLRTLQESLTDNKERSRAVAVRPGVGGRAAAVLILLGESESKPDLLFIERASTLRQHAGQIAFPGGAVENADSDLAATAVREAEEETGLDPSGVEIIGTLPPVQVPVSGFDVTAVLSWWRQPSAVTAADPDEVASVHRIAVDELVNPDIRVTVRHPSGYSGPAFQVHGLLIWGLTAHLVDAVLDLGGWQRPWDRTRTAPIPARYLINHHKGHHDHGR